MFKLIISSLPSTLFNHRLFQHFLWWNKISGVTLDLSERLGIYWAVLSVLNTVSFFLHLTTFIATVKDGSWLEVQIFGKVHSYIRVGSQVPV